MALALLVLAAGSVIAGYAGVPALLGGGDWFARYLEPSFGAAPVEQAVEHGLEGTLMLVSVAAALVGICIAFYFFLKNRRAAEDMAGRFSGVRTLPPVSMRASPFSRTSRWPRPRKSSPVWASATCSTM